MVKNVTIRYGGEGGGRRRAEEGVGGGREEEETIKGGGEGKKKWKRRSEADTVLRKQSQWTEDLQTPTHWPGSNRRLKPDPRWPTYQSFFRFLFSGNKCRTRGRFCTVVPGDFPVRGDGQNSAFLT